MSDNLNLPWKVDQYRSVIDATGETVKANGFASVMAYSDSQIASRERSAFIVKAVNNHEALVSALEEMTEHYCSMVASGDCGFWDPEKDDPVKHARTALSQAKGA